MNLEDCYEDKKLIIEDLMNQFVLPVLFDDIESDEDYSLSTDETTELCIDLVKMWAEKEL